MFESILNATDTSITAGSAMLCLTTSVLLGLGIAACYMLTQKKSGYTKDFVIAIALLPSIVSVVIMLVGSNVARALSLAGAFALVRFRSAPGSAKDIAVVFFTMACGLASGLGFLIFGLIAACVICALLIILTKTGFGEKKTEEKQLKITIPEDLNYNGIFDDLFAEYTNRYKLQRVRTTNMGSLYELLYLVEMKEGAKEKDFIDSLRCRNGNLNISLGILPDRNELTL